MSSLLETASSTDSKVLSTDNDKLPVIILGTLFSVVRICIKNHIELNLALNHLECVSLVSFR